MIKKIYLIIYCLSISAYANESSEHIFSSYVVYSQTKILRTIAAELINEPNLIVESLKKLKIDENVVGQERCKHVLAFVINDRVSLGFYRLIALSTFYDDFGKNCFEEILNKGLLLQEDFIKIRYCQTVAHLLTLYKNAHIINLNSYTQCEIDNSFSQVLADNLHEEQYGINTSKNFQQLAHRMNLDKYLTD